MGLARRREEDSIIWHKVKLVDMENKGQTKIKDE
jgi:hypothetical protein